MTSSAMKRLEHVAQLLTAKQATLLEIREATNFETLGDYVMWQAERPGWPMRWTLGERIRQRMSGRPKLEVEQAIYESRSAIEFLWDLYLCVNTSVSSRCLYVLLNLMCITRSALDEDNLIQEIALAATSKTGSKNPRPKFWVAIEENLRELYATRKAVAETQEKHFGGQPFLMKSYAEDLACLIDLYEQAAHISNRLFLGLNRVSGMHARELEDFFDPMMLNLQEIENSSEALAAATVSDWVKETKASALIRAGKVGDGLSLLAACIRSARAKRAKGTGTGQSGQ